MTKKRGEEIKKEGLQDILGVVFTAAAVLFLLYVMSSVFNDGFNNAGDNYMHTALSYYVNRLVSEEGTVFGWFNLFQSGLPLLYMYQPLFYIIVVFIHKVTALDLLFSEKTLLVFLIGAYPLSLYYFLTRLGHPKLVAGLAALFAATSNMGWGNNMTSYFYSGIVSQALAMFLFPIALGLFYETFQKNRNITLLSVVLVLSMLSHLLINYMLIINLSLLFVLLVLGYKRNAILFFVRKYAIVLIVVVLVSSFFSVPAASLSKYQLHDVLKRTGSVYSGFQRNSLTLVQTVDYLVDGSLFDKTNSFLRGNNWYDNSKQKRQPILTAFIILGLTLALTKVGDIKHGFLSIGFLTALMFLSGADDMPLLGLLPLQGQMFYVRVSAVFEFFGVCLAGVGLYYGCEAIIRMLATRIKFDGSTYLTLLILLSSTMAFAPLWQERYAVAQDTVDTAYHSQFKEMEKLFGSVKYDPSGRLLVGRELNLNNHETQPLFAVSSKLPIIMTPNWDPRYPAQQLLYRLVSQDSRNESLIKGIPYKPQLIDLYNVKYMLADRSWEKDPKKALVKNNITLLAKTQNYLFYEVDETPTYFKFTPSKPSLIIASDDTWYSFGLQWILTYQKSNEYSKLPFTVRADTRVLDEVEFDADKYPVTLIMDYVIRDQAVVERKLEEYAKSGGIIVSWENLSYSTTDLVARHGSSWMDVTLPENPHYPGDARIYNTLSGLQEYSMNYDAPTDRFLIFKMSYFPTWEVTVDGKETEYYDVTPNFVGIWVPAGRHTVEVRYTNSSWYWTYLLVIAGATILYLSAQKNLFALKRLPDYAIKRPILYAAVAAAALLLITSTYVLEKYYNMPIVEGPNFAESYPAHKIPFKWNRAAITDPGRYQAILDNKTTPDYPATVSYEMQISENPILFDQAIVYSLNTTSREKYLETDAIKPGMLYAWRVRTIVNGQPNPWSTTAYFTTYKNTPNIGNILIKSG
ncbi:MAG: hypothetical protein V1744_05385 [Candidatus Altiarchaeota archaeon]